MWATLEWYHDEYLKGDTAIIPDASFARWEQEARMRINWQNIPEDEVIIIDRLSMCVCAVAEKLYTFSVANQFRASDGDSDDSQLPVSSFSNDGYSVSFIDTMKGYRGMSQSNQDAEINAIIRRFLAYTALHNLFVFRGV